MTHTVSLYDQGFELTTIFVVVFRFNGHPCGNLLVWERVLSSLDISCNSLYGTGKNTFGTKLFY